MNNDKTKLLNQHKSHIDKLMRNPTKALVVPLKPAPLSASATAPLEFDKNVKSSIAGAGSDGFHNYRAAKQKEEARLLALREQEEQKKGQREFRERKRRMEEADEGKTAKNRQRRMKRKKTKESKVKQEDGKVKEGKNGETAQVEVEVKKTLVEDTVATKSDEEKGQSVGKITDQESVDKESKKEPGKGTTKALAEDG